jgi:tetratricopeptide (TPR) repeat protein
MMRMVMLVAAAVSASSAVAAEKLSIGQPATWVRPLAAPADEKADGLPIKLLLQDEQYDLQPGRQSRYSESVYRIQAPQGLASGAIALAWDPATQAVTVHKLQVRRGTQVIDVLASGQSFTVVRRESNLEYATIDGILTATLQPEGLQVGDAIDFAATVVSSDPAVGQHVEQLAAGWNGIPVSHAHMRAQWPAATNLRLRATGGLPLPKPVRKNGLTSIELSLDNLQPLVPPKGAPMRYQYGRLIEMTDLTSWSDLAAIEAPLYAKAATVAPNGALHGEIARIAASTTDPIKRAEAALALVQDRIRYVALFLNDGGLIPADADTTWSHRFGDCKGKTAVLLGMLRELGIDAQPVTVSSVMGDGIDQRLPMLALFNHVIIRATIGGKAYWLDGTRLGDRRLDGLTIPPFYWGLALAPGSSQLIALMPPPRTEPDTDVAIRIDASKGLTLPTPMHVDRVLRGDEAVVTNLKLASLAPDTRDNALREFWKGRYDFVDVKQAATSFDPDKRQLTLTMDGNATMDWSTGWYEADSVWVGYKADFQRDPGADQDAPYAVAYPSYVKVRETILLPPGGFTIDKAEADVNQTVAGIAYHRVADLVGNRFTVEESERSIAAEFPAKDAAAAQATLRGLFKRQVYIKRPSNYAGTIEELAALDKTTPSSADDYIYRGYSYLAHGMSDKAIADYDKALAINPKLALALSNRGAARAIRAEYDAAKRDFDAALAIDPQDAVALRGRAMIAQKHHAVDEAIAGYTASLQVDPDNGYALGHRAEMEADKGDIDAALADSAAALKLQPGWLDLYLLRANMLRHKGEDGAAQKEAEALVAAGPTESWALVAAGKIYAAYDRRADAMAMFDRALAIKPDAQVYSNRADVRVRTDFAGRQADLDAAIKLDPEWAEPLIAKAELALEQKRPSEAAAALAATARLETDDASELVRRGIAYQRIGDSAHAHADFAAARKQTSAAHELNGLCWQKATAGVGLELALAECDAALALSPGDAAILDSRALVLLRLNRIDEAISAYDNALAKRPGVASSLYGRAIAEARNGNKTASDRDVAAALKADPKTRDEFAGYGIDIGPSGRKL